MMSPDLLKQLQGLSAPELRDLLKAAGYRIMKTPEFHGKAEPDIEVRCACGSRWFGKAALNNHVIDLHRDRVIHDYCKVGDPMPRTDTEYRARHPLPATTKG